MYLLREANEYEFYRWPFRLTVTEVAMATIAIETTAIPKIKASTLALSVLSRFQMKVYIRTRNVLTKSLPSPRVMKIPKR